MDLKRITAVIICALMLFSLIGCGGESGGSGEGGRNTDYTSPAEFEGQAHKASVFFVNVGKADCAIVTVDGRTWLIDAGTEASFINTCAALAYLGAERIDGAILTHEHADHIGGLSAIAQKYPVASAYYPEYLLSRLEIDEELALCSVSGTAVKAGDTIPAAEGVVFDVLAPERMDPEDDNDNSLVVMLAVNGRRFLFTGDMQKTEDGILTESGRDITCDVLKVPNHGNADAVSDAFAKAAAPLISVISTDTHVDANSASPKVRAKLAASEIYLTEDHDLGVLINVSEKGELSVSFPERTQALTGAVLTEASKADQTFTVANTTAQSLDISGWFVYSSKGYEVFVFPQGTAIPANGSLLVACRKSDKASEADLVWSEKKVWATNKDDDAVLCDPNGNEVSRRASE